MSEDTRAYSRITAVQVQLTSSSFFVQKIASVYIVSASLIQGYIGIEKQPITCVCVCVNRFKHKRLLGLRIKKNDEYGN